MKKMILGIVWQILGFFGAIIILITVAPERWNYDGITGILGSLLGMSLIFPFIFCVVLFVLGVVLCVMSMRETEK